MKEKFAELVEGHFLRRVKPFNQPIVVAAHGAEEAVGITSMALDVRFDLPPAIDGEGKYYKSYIREDCLNSVY